MKPKLQELGAPISLEELLRPSAPEMDLNQPVEAAPLPINTETPRSTTDPFEINFATVDIARKLQTPFAGTGVRIFALVFFGVPTTIFGLGLAVMAWSDPQMDTISALFNSVLGLAAAVFWPYIIFANRRKESRSS